MARTWLWPLLLLVLALSLRFYRLGAPSLWYDEGATLRDVHALSSHATYRPLYYLLMRAWTTLGSGEAWLRVPSAFASTCSVVLLFVLARRHVGQRAAVLAALLMTLSVQELDHAQEARMYAFGTLLSLGAVSLLRRWNERRDTATLAGHIVVSASSLATTPVALLLVAPAVAYTAWHVRREKRDLAWLAGAWLALLALLVPLAPAAGEALARILSAPRWSAWPPLRELAYLPAKLLVSPIGFLASSRALTALFGVLGALCLGLLVVAALPRRHEPTRGGGTLLVLWFVLPCVLMFGVARTVVPFWTTRYFLALAPVLYLAVAVGIERVIGVARVPGVAVAAFVLALLAVRATFHFVEPQREDWRAVVAYANAVAMPGDVVWLGGSGVAAIWSFYDRSGLPTRELWSGARGEAEPPVATAVAPAYRHRGRVLLILRTTVDASRELAVPELLSPGSRLLGSFRSGWATAQVVLPGTPESQPEFLDEVRNEGAARAQVRISASSPARHLHSWRRPDLPCSRIRTTTATNAGRRRASAVAPVARAGRKALTTAKATKLASPVVAAATYQPVTSPRR